MRYYEILRESGDADLFHFTNRYALCDILESDRLGKRDRGVSLTRDSNHLFLKGRLNAALVIDGRKLRHRYRLTQDFGDARNFPNTLGALAQHREAEERTDRPIYPLSAVLKEIVVAPDIAYQSVTDKIARLLKRPVPITVGTMKQGSPWYRKRKSLENYYSLITHEEDW